MNKDFLNQQYNKEDFLDFIKWSMPDFVAENATITPEHEIFQKVSVLGKSLKNELAIIEIKTRKVKNNERVSITKEAFRIMSKRGISHALICFYAGGQSWRMSLLTTNVVFKDGKIKREGSNPRRYSYYLGEKAKTKTPYKFLIEKGPVDSLETLKERFSVEVVNREFYNSVAELFTKLVGGKRAKKEYDGLLKLYNQSGPSREKQEFAVRLIGRIVFCWFLKKKHSSSGKPLISDDILSVRAISTHSDYYHSILEPLFFELLNKPMNSRSEPLNEVPFSDVPYLNGGLFNPQENDFYNQNNFNGAGTPGLVTIPDSWFIELFELFNQYNFTIDENTSYDVDLSIDPEMLGRIFENLLAEINPETGETARKSTGSFYTPREIVDYMVDNSLLYYLKDKTGISKTKLKAIISYSKEDDEEYSLEVDESREIIDALDKLSILDPACGSGAFPIGILQKVVYILQQADEGGKLWFEKQIENIPSIEMRNDLKAKYESGNYDYIRKLGVIRQSIFGVDIQTIATEIAKLRCFLTLVIEEDVNDEEQNRGVHPLPNLDFKFVTANSLVGLPCEKKVSQDTSLLEDSSHIDSLKRIRSEYFTADASRRIELRNDFDSIQKKMLLNTIDIYRGGGASKRYDHLMRWDPFQNKPSKWFDSEWMFGIKKFDIVIANPPYVHLEKIKDEASRLYEPLNYKTYTKRGDLYALFFERGVELLENRGILTFITSNKWMRAGYGESLRNFFVENTHPIQLIDLGGGVFESATVDTDIIILKKEPYFADTIAVAANKNLNAKNIDSFIQEQAVNIKFGRNESWTILSPIERSIKEKIERFGTPLKDWDVKINRGILTGCNEAFIINEETRAKLIAEDPKSAEIIRPILRGKDIKRNSYDWAGLYLINTHNGYVDSAGIKHPAINIDDYPAIKKWLDSEQWNNKSDKCTSIERLRKRTDQGRTPYNLRDCAYMDDFSMQKIVFPAIMSKDAFFAYDESGAVIVAPGNIITGGIDLKKLLLVLTSVGYWALKHFYMGGGIEGELKVNRLQSLPIPLNIQNIETIESVYELYNFSQAEIDFIEKSL